ncbi:MAG: SDR family oxidoreductase [Eubacteriales bacterium]|nr:SDR family oxidoreductase [Eubacteriales bacterium]
MLNTQLEALASMSNKYGADDNFVLAGGGNTSFKNSAELYIKGSGTSLATIKPEDFVVMRRNALAEMWNKKYSENEEKRESEVLADMMNARGTGMESRRPSVETLLHDIFPQSYVLHVHPALVNGLTCSRNGKKITESLFPDAVWVPACKPGYVLALECRQAMDRYSASTGKQADMLFLENHGVFFAAETTEQLDILAVSVMEKLRGQIKRFPDFNKIDFDIDAAVSIAPVLRMLYSEGKPATVRFITNPEILKYDPATDSVTPDHIVYAKAKQLAIPADCSDDAIKDLFDAFVSKNGYKPKIVFVESLGMFSCGADVKEAAVAEAVFLDALKIAAYAESFGGLSPMPEFLIDFIVNWEVENYRSKVSLAGVNAKRFNGKIVVVTGGAQGFGKGIADCMHDEGAYVVIADMNYDGAKAAVSEYGIQGHAVSADVSSEESVKNMINETVLVFGGIDVFINNAGIVKAGSLDEMQKGAFDAVTAVNYTGYFLCAKYASKIMKIQHKYAPDYLMDIIEINSKSGLTGSNRNFAYAGSKFGGIGLTQSFALELVEYNIKVNAVCPGNFLNGPLWSDPEKGLFVQYLRTGKVPGARTVDDVRRHYESKVPLGRGCETIDVARAIFYIIEQTYETGQAIPVTGGQEMLK